MDFFQKGGGDPRQSKSFGTLFVQQQFWNYGQKKEMQINTSLERKQLQQLRKLLKKKCSFIMDFFQKGLTPPSPPTLSELLGHFFVG